MDRRDKKEVMKLQEESELFNDMSVEQLLYACIIGTDFEDVVWNLVLTNWSRHDPRCKYRGNSKKSKITKITVASDKTEREIDVSQLDPELRLHRILSYL